MERDIGKGRGILRTAVEMRSVSRRPGKEIVKTAVRRGVILTAILVLSGCYTTGLSMREKGVFSYSNFIYSLYENRTNDAAPGPIEFPIRLAVAQIGENAPPQTFLDRLREGSTLISEVSPLPAAGWDPNDYYGDEGKKAAGRKVRVLVEQMRRLAGDVGADYILLFGGSVDTVEQANALWIFDITGVAAVLFPSHKISGEGRAAATLIDVRTGGAVFTVSTQAEGSRYAPTLLADGRETKLRVGIRDELVADLADRFIDRLRIVR